MKPIKHVSESDLALFLDGHLAPNRAGQVQELMASSAQFRNEVLGFEKVKAVLAASPKLSPLAATDQFILNFIANEPAVATPWFSPILGVCDALVNGLAIMPRSVALALILGVISGVSIGTVAAIERKQAPHVMAREGNPGHLIAGNRLPLNEGADIQLGVPIITGRAEKITINRKDLFSLQLGENTEASAQKLSFLGKFGRNEIELNHGSVMFKSEKLLPQGGIAIQTPLCTIVNHGTIALINYDPKGIMSVAVLEGGVSIDFKSVAAHQRSKRIFVKSLQEYSFNPNEPAGTTQPISQYALERLTDFTSERLILLGLPQNRAAAALVDTEMMSAVFTYFNIPEKAVQTKLEMTKKLFSQNDPRALLEARQILGELGNQYEKEGQLHMSAPLLLFVASVSSYLDDDEGTLVSLDHVIKNRGYSEETRALALCAVGIVRERQKDLKSAIEAYKTIESKFSNTSVLAEASERLKRLSSR